MRGNLDRTLLVGGGLIAALLVAIAALTYRNTRQLDRDASWVAHTNAVLDLTAEVLLTMVDAETGQRGFLITGREEYLEPYKSSRNRLDGLVANLGHETRDNGAQQERIARLTEMITTRLSGLEEAIELRRENEEKAKALVLTGVAKAQMDAIRHLVAEMRVDEQRLLADRRLQSRHAYETAIASGIITALAGLALVAGVVWLLHRGFLVRQQAAAVLQEQREWFRTTLAGIGDAVIATDTQGHVRFLNSVAQEITGWSALAAEGQPVESVFNICNEQTRKTVENPAARALREGIIVGLANHTILISRDGTERPIDDSAAPIRDAEGQVTGAVLVFRDITDRRQAEDNLAERVRLMAMSAEVGAALTQGDRLTHVLERCLQALVDSLNGGVAGIWTLDAETQRLMLEASAGRSTPIDGSHAGVPVGDAEIGLIARERKSHFTNDLGGDPRVPDQDWAQREGMVAFAGFPLNVEDRLVGVMALFARQPLTQQTLEAMATVADQIALGIERKWAGQQVVRLLELEQERSERLRQVAAASLTINSANTPTSVLDVFRAEARRIIGTTQSDLFLQAEKPPLDGQLHAALVGHGGRLLGHIVLAGKTRGSFTKDDEAILIQLAHMAAVAYDNARLYEELRESDRRKDEFLVTLAHEMRNPLAPIRNAIHVMRLAGDDRSAIDESRAMIERQVLQLVRLVDDLLDLSRVRRGLIDLRSEQIELETVLTVAVEISRPLIEQSGHELTLALPQEPIPLVADPTRMVQVFSNLLNNAAKYTEPCGHIWISAQRETDWVTVRVRDNGLGIPTDMLTRIFELFTQVDQTTERSQGGLGIGLTLVKRLVELHGGTIQARSDGPGRGSEFELRLPISARQQATKSVAVNGECSGPRRSLRILVVDDNRDAAESLGMMLDFMGNDVRTANDGLEAVSLAASFNPDVVFMDIGLPSINGFEAAHRMRKQPGGQNRLIVALTGWGQEEDRRRAHEAGFDQHIVKPVNPETLEQLLDELETATTRILRDPGPAISS